MRDGHLYDHSFKNMETNKEAYTDVIFFNVNELLRLPDY